jgi:hypothetical protein
MSDEPVDPQSLTRRWIAIGFGSFAIAFPLAWLLLPRLAPIAAPVDRLLLAVQLAAGPSVVLLLVLQGLWRVQDSADAEDPFAGKETYAFKVNQRVMSNTLEQTMIFVPLFVALAVRMQPDQTYWLPLLMGFFCAGRLLFWAGYRRALHLRAPGMDWTTATTIVTLVLLVKTLS